MFSNYLKNDPSIQTFKGHGHTIIPILTNFQSGGSGTIFFLRMQDEIHIF